jgi:5-methyltetrahydrofolate--homocysteine methyltransferase
MIDVAKIYEAISNGDVETVKRLTHEALDAGETAKNVLENGLITALDRIGVKFKNNEIYIPEVLIAARAMHAGMAVLKPFLAQSGGAVQGKFLIGTVKGDLHDIGKNLVATMVEGGGFDVVDLGVDVSSEKFVEAIRTHHPQIVGVSALLTTTIKEMRHTIQAIEAANLRQGVKILVGGAPVTEKYAQEIGADGYAPDAASAVDKARSLLV